MNCSTMSEAFDRGKDGLIRAATRALLVAILVAPGCGGDDSQGGEPEPVADATAEDSAARKDSAVDTAPEREGSVEANLDRSVPPDQAADTSANRSDAGDASRDVGNERPVDTGAGDIVIARDAAPEVLAEASPPDAGADRADAVDDRVASNDGASDAPVDVASVVEASADAVDAAFASEPEIESSTGSEADGSTPDAAEANDASEAGSSLAPQSWVI